ncbi:MAG: glycosyltransferase [Rubrivivax sp.]|nr:glycosyltransferase [Rubrivivax sp.]
MPLISIVIPTFRSAALLPGAIDSIAAQTWRDFELIVSDGASDDGTSDLARGRAAELPALQVDSRPDSGVYDAINRGIALARGEWVLVLGSDDRLHAPDTLARAAEALRASTAELVHGDVRMMADSPDGVPAGGRYAGPMPLARLLKANVCQQAIFYRRSLWQRLGGFEPRYRLWADWAFNLRAAFEAPPQWIDLIVADYAATGMSARQSDAVLQAEMPELIRREFAARVGDPALKPLARHLMRQADALRRRGRWREAWRQIGTWARVRWG